MPIEPAPPEPSSPPLHEAAAADPHHPGHPRHTHCQNCGTLLTGPFCAQCGQHDLDFHQSFGHVLLEALENFFHFDSKLFRNIVTLLFQPGRLAAEFNAGKRAAQMPPFRLYLFVSVLFFFVSFLGDDHTPPIIADADKVAAVRLAGAETLLGTAGGAADPAVKARLEALAAQLREPASKLTEEQLRELPSGVADRIRQAMAAEKSSAKTAVEPKKTVGPGGRVQEKDDTALEHYLAEKGRYAFEHQHEIREAFIHAFSKMLLACLPFFALYSWFLFRRSGQVYLQHLVVALHYHTFVYLWWLVVQGWVGLIGLRSTGLAGLVEFAAGVWTTLYPFLMLRRLFGESRWRTFFKTLALAAIYTLTLVLGFLLTAVVVFMTV